MRLFERTPDGGHGSGVTGYFIVEIKSLFSIVLLHFAAGSREAYHEHAFDAWTLWLYVAAIEHFEDHRPPLLWTGGDLKYTSRDCFHKLYAIRDTWALSFRGPWTDTWRESRKGKHVTLTHGRTIVREPEVGDPGPGGGWTVGR